MEFQFIDVWTTPKGGKIQITSRYPPLIYGAKGESRLCAFNLLIFHIDQMLKVKYSFHICSMLASYDDR